MCWLLKPCSPVTSGTEMAGQPGENAIADAVAAGNLAGSDGVSAHIDGYRND